MLSRVQLFVYAMVDYYNYYTTRGTDSLIMLDIMRCLFIRV